MSLISKVVAVLLALFLVAYLMGYKVLISITNSLPFTIFVETPNKDFTTGNIVTFKYQYKEYFIYKQGQNFTKIIGCAQGQKISTIGNDYFCENKLIGTALEKDGFNNAIERQIYNEVIPQGKFFMIGSNPKSYDSKYYGYVDIKDILGVTYGIY